MYVFRLWFFPIYFDNMFKNIYPIPIAGQKYLFTFIHASAQNIIIYFYPWFPQN